MFVATKIILVAAPASDSRRYMNNSVRLGYERRKALGAADHSEIKPLLDCCDSGSDGCDSCCCSSVPEMTRLVHTEHCSDTYVLGAHGAVLVLRPE